MTENNDVMSMFQTLWGMRRIPGMHPLMVFLVTSVILVATQSVSGEKVSYKDIVNHKTEKDSLVFRYIVNHSSIFYPDPQLDSSSVFAQLKDKRLFLYKKDRTVKIKKIQVKDSRSRIVVKFENFDLDETQIEFISPFKQPITQEVFENLLQRVFRAPSDSTAFSYYSVDTVTSMIHVRGANHIPNHYLLASDVSSYIDSGYGRCMACFPPQINIPGYEIEIALRQGAIESYRYYNPISFNDTMQSVITKLGEKILNHWPLPLRGYRYTFYALSNDQPQALAFPAGEVYVHTGLVSLAGDTMELEAVLAHEIAHVELRHGYRDFIKRQKKGLLADLLGGGAFLLATLLSKDTDLGTAVGELTQSLVSFANELALAGYNRNQETEADDIATIYMKSNYGDAGVEYLPRVLKKMRYADNLVDRDVKVGSYDSHPKVVAREHHLNQLVLLSLDRSEVFVGYDSTGRELGTLKLLLFAQESYMNTVKEDYYHKGRSMIVYRTTVYASIETTEYTYTTVEAKHFHLWANGTKYKFDNKEDTQIAPLSSAGAVFVCTSKSPIPVNSIEQINVSLGSSIEWKRRE